MKRKKAEAFLARNPQIKLEELKKLSKYLDCLWDFGRVTNKKDAFVNLMEVEKAMRKPNAKP